MNWGASYGSGRDSSIVQGTTPVVAVTAVTATGKLREWRRQSWTRGAAALGASGHGWEGENMKWHVGQPPPLFI